ncbi:TadE/TadG family type IV pilus assembly protein [Trinickia sp.]|uniref:TadE/TadG family type IV pilus assembly protein n=1 Tax=Trinickia sp. TaxID=2571163 RepID=UPI0039C99FAE
MNLLSTGGPVRKGKETMKRQRGAAAVEMALVLPFLLLLFLGLIQFGWLLLNSVSVVNAASDTARFFASQRGVATPYTNTQAQVRAAASLLTPSGLSVTTTVNGVACTSDAGCAAALASASSPSVSIPATVTVTYSSFRPIFSGPVYSLDFTMPSQLTSSATERVQ